MTTLEEFLNWTITNPKSHNLLAIWSPYPGLKTGQLYVIDKNPEIVRGRFLSYGATLKVAKHICQYAPLVIRDPENKTLTTWHSEDCEQFVTVDDLEKIRKEDIYVQLERESYTNQLSSH